jgi:uncharacterized membrane protein YoaK (UPF0700 family)
MNETSEGGNAFKISIGLAFVGAYGSPRPVTAIFAIIAIAMLIEVLLFLSAFLFLSNRANEELFIVCMCLALGIQNGALDKTNGISVHSTYMTGMVTTLMQKSFDHLSSKRSPKEESSRDSARLTIQVLAPMWISFIFGAVTGAVIVSSFHSIGLLGIVLSLILLILIKMNRRLTDTADSRTRSD